VVDGGRAGWLVVGVVFGSTVVGGVGLTVVVVVGLPLASRSWVTSITGTVFVPPRLVSYVSGTVEAAD
jgi:hypothetical protein